VSSGDLEKMLPESLAEFNQNFIDTLRNSGKILPNMYSALALHHHAHHFKSLQDRVPWRAPLN
jgi:hypothetical protein